MSGLDKSLDDLINEQRNVRDKNKNQSSRKKKTGKQKLSNRESLPPMTKGRIRKKRMGNKRRMDIDNQEGGGKTWKHDKFGASGGASSSKRNRITRVEVSNLAQGVTNKDINDLFSEVGKLRQALIKFDQTGRSTGKALVVFYNREDAIEAIKRYNGVPLDGKPMKLSLITERTTNRNRIQTDRSGDSNRRIIITTTGRNRKRQWRQKGFSSNRGNAMKDRMLDE